MQTLHQLRLAAFGFTECACVWNLKGKEPDMLLNPMEDG